MTAADATCESRAVCVSTRSSATTSSDSAVFDDLEIQIVNLQVFQVQPGGIFPAEHGTLTPEVSHFLQGSKAEKGEIHGGTMVQIHGSHGGKSRAIIPGPTILWDVALLLCSASISQDAPV
jgi:hypothetical protein